MKPSTMAGSLERLRARMHLARSSAISGVHQYTFPFCLVPGTERGIDASHAAFMSRRRFSASSSMFFSSVRVSQFQAATMAIAWSIPLSLSLRRHLGGGRERSIPLMPRVFLASIVSSPISMNIYRWSERVSTPSATSQPETRWKALGLPHVISTTEHPLHATH